MTHDLSSARQALQTIEENDAHAIRQRVLEILREACHADFLYYSYAWQAGDPYYTRFVASGLDLERISHLDGGRSLVDTYWDPQRPRDQEIGEFVIFDDLRFDLEALRETSIHSEFYAPLEITDQSRMLVYDGPRFIGWIGALRRAGEIIDASTNGLLNELAPYVTTALVAAHRADELPDEPPGHILVHPDGRHIEFATGQAASWLDERRADRIAQVVRRADRGEAMPASILVDGLKIHLARMHGAAGTRYLLSIEATSAPRIHPTAVLTDRQREVAEYAAAAATNNEIADTLGISPETVRDHLRAVYEKLDLANKLELAVRLTDEDE